MEDTDSQKGHEEFKSELEKIKRAKYMKLLACMVFHDEG